MGAWFLHSAKAAIIVGKFSYSCATDSTKEMESDSLLIPMELILFYPGPNGSNEWEKS